MELDERPILYSYWRSSCSWRVRTSLLWKNIDYNTIPVNLLVNEHKSAEYTAINPMQEVPTLVIDGNTLTQSLAILEYLEETHTEKPLLPSDPLTRAKVRSLVGAIAIDTQPAQNLRILKYVGDEKSQDWAKHWITWAFEGIEKQLSSTAGNYCVGDEVTLADVCLVPQVFNARRCGVDMSRFPIISRIDANCVKLEAFKLSDPYAQIDCSEPKGT
ncbi:7981_t:CDS:2 [Paraglomus brasilianum]|uniref:7981_t:CDS:1 n=1 Tax=Paraglomus brasilianum TaxID=144538 RepID=A0A9N8W3L9_9GLOM|nr:7981_t:CDS:2 [Paraglomus brasilianum]